MSVTTWTIPYESKEWIGPIVITANGVATTDFMVALIPDGARPVLDDWVAPTVEGGEQGIMFDGQAPGSYKIWAKYTTATEEPVLDNVGIVVAH